MFAAQLDHTVSMLSGIQRRDGRTYLVYTPCVGQRVVMSAGRVLLSVARKYSEIRFPHTGNRNLPASSQCFSSREFDLGHDGSLRMCPELLLSLIYGNQ